jgi:hypothetical protein
MKLESSGIEYEVNNDSPARLRAALALLGRNDTNIILDEYFPA